MSSKVRFLDPLRFLGAWVKNPREVAAIAPSGQALAELITSEIGAGTGPILELGPGTGVFTKALVDRGVDEGELVLVENGAQFLAPLHRRFPRARIVRMDAADLTGRDLAGERPFAAVICGLGLLNMERRKVAAIVAGSVRQMRPDGAFFLFTYGRRCSVPEATLAALGLSVEHVGRTLRNVPPASVFRLTRNG